MPAAPLPIDEKSRLNSLREYSVMHTSPERDFDEITSLATYICKAPMALIGFIDESQEWVKSEVGLACGASPREDSFCQYVILDPSNAMVILDTWLDERFKNHPSVLGGPKIRFYAGVPVVAPGGGAVGTLCIIDTAPRLDLDPDQLTALKALSRQVTTLLELRKSVLGLETAMNEQRWYTEQLEAYQKKLEDTNVYLELQSNRDGLTGLVNRGGFEKRLVEEADRGRRYGFPVSLLMIDADQFKTYNDAYGHPAGDEVLRTLAAKIQAGARVSDTVARYGGEEFVVILPQTGCEGALILAERMRRGVESAAWPQRKVTISIGTATLEGESLKEKNLVASADLALYESKRLGRNRVCQAPPHSVG